MVAVEVDHTPAAGEVAVALHNTAVEEGNRAVGHIPVLPEEVDQILLVPLEEAGHIQVGRKRRAAGGKQVGLGMLPRAVVLRGNWEKAGQRRRLADMAGWLKGAGKVC